LPLFADTELAALGGSDRAGALAAEQLCTRIRAFLDQLPSVNS
jgi:hypothetical protein